MKQVTMIDYSDPPTVICPKCEKPIPTYFIPRHENWELRRTPFLCGHKCSADGEPVEIASVIPAVKPKP